VQKASVEEGDKEPAKYRGRLPRSHEGVLLVSRPYAMGHHSTSRGPCHRLTSACNPPVPPNFALHPPTPPCGTDDAQPADCFL